MKKFLVKVPVRNVCELDFLWALKDSVYNWLCENIGDGDESDDTDDTDAWHASIEFSKDVTANFWFVDQKAAALFRLIYG
jgi:hypothetical protein